MRDMNKKQEKCVWIGLIIFVLMCLFPPWIHFYMVGGNHDPVDRIIGEPIYTCIGYGFLFSPPPDVTSADMTRLIPQLLIVVVITVWLVYLRRDKPPEPAKK